MKIFSHLFSFQSAAKMMKSVFGIISRSCADKRTLIWQSTRLCHKVSHTTRTVPRILSDATSIDEFQYFSMKIKDLMDNEQLDYFENVIKKVENINHPIAELMK
jgi:hypothetical protein